MNKGFKQVALGLLALGAINIAHAAEYRKVQADKSAINFTYKQMGVAVDGSDQWWPEAQGPARLPVFSPYQSQPAQYIEVFNRGTEPFRYRI